ncbi:hypothetical protein BH10PSE7_BH10PSE7_20990 [soil metagenome]
MPGFRTLLLATLIAATTALPVFAGSEKVRIFTPASSRTFIAVTPLPSGDGPPIITVFIRLSNRHLNAERAAFQTWTGFRKQYSGRRYPF